jgi:hypothetical protein
MPEFYDGQGNKRHIGNGTYGEYQSTLSFDNYRNVPGSSAALISKISTNESVLSFSYDLTSSKNYFVKPLTSISVIGKYGVQVRRFDFTYNRLPPLGYLHSQFLLSSISIRSNAVTHGSYNFDYTTVQPFDMAYDPQNNSTFTYFTNTTGVDHWGYYSGIVPSYYSLIPGIPTYGPANNYNGIFSRSPNPTTTQALTVRKITYPTGGWVEYEYENNDYRYVSNGQLKSSNVLAGGLRIKSIRKHDAFASSSATDVVKRYEYKSLTNPAYSSGVIETEPLYSFFISPIQA